MNAYSEGLAAGAEWFNTGIEKGKWQVPPNPYQEGTEEAEDWERGLNHAFFDLENAYYS